MATEHDFPTPAGRARAQRKTSKVKMGRSPLKEGPKMKLFEKKACYAIYPTKFELNLSALVYFSNTSAAKAFVSCFAKL